MPDDRCPKCGTSTYKTQRISCETLAVCPNILCRWSAQTCEPRRQLAALTERAEKAEARVATLGVERDEEVDEFNAGYEAAGRGEPLEAEPSGLKHDQWVVGWYWFMGEELKERAEKAEADLAEVQSKLDRCETVDALRIREIHSYATKQDAQRKRIAELQAEVERLREVCEAVVDSAAPLGEGPFNDALSGAEMETFCRALAVCEAEIAESEQPSEGERLRELVALVRELDAAYTPGGWVQDGVDVDAIWVRMREVVKQAAEPESEGDDAT